MDKLAAQIALVYVDKGYTDAKRAFNSTCKDFGIFGWSRLFLSAKVKIFLKENHPSFYARFRSEIR